MKVKLNRGPGAGKRLEQPDYTVTVVYQEPKMDFRHRMASQDMYTMHMDLAYRRGTYSKSNVKLKDGTWVFEWMGWIS